MKLFAVLSIWANSSLPPTIKLQFMKNIFCYTYNPVILIAILFFSSCSGKSDGNKAVIKALQESLENSNNSINISNNQILQSLDEKSSDYVTKERASMWLPKAQQIQKLSDEIFNYIEGLKKSIKVNNEVVNELFARLIKYKEDILAVDSLIKYEFRGNITLISKAFDTSKQTGNDFYKPFFRNSTPLLISAMLTKLQGSVKVIENKTIAYCHNQIGSTDGHGFYTFFEAIVGQSSKILKPGQFIEITAAVARISMESKPEFSINRNLVDVNENGLAIYKFRVPKKPGNYSTPIRIKYTDENGLAVSRDYTVEYAVSKECDQ